MRRFRAPKTALGTLDAEVAAALIAQASDIALIVDAAGVIRDVAIAEQDLADSLRGHTRWQGRPWADIVTEDSRTKVALLLSDAASQRSAQWRHLNHAGASGPDVPILYAAVPAGPAGRIVAFGRDLRAVSSLQRRLVEAQQVMERDYDRVRLSETRYRLLFQVASDAVLVVDGASRRVLDSNPAARRLFAGAAAPGSVWSIGRLFTAATARAVELLLAGVVASGRADDVRASLAEGDLDVIVSASLFRDAAGVACLLRIAMPGADPAGTMVPKLRSKLLKLMDSAPDAFVVTGDDGRVITANAAFLQLAQLPTEESARGELLERWLGPDGTDLAIMIAHLRHHGAIRLFATTVRGEFGEPASVEISAVTVMNGGAPCYGFAIRDIGRRLASPGQRERTLSRPLEHLSELIGRVALKDLVREATGVIERLCIEAALELSSDNRASAAELLGLSRQSLYVKLRRYGLGDLAAEGPDGA